jgi:hypothetical protein
MPRTVHPRWWCLAKVVEKMQGGGWLSPQELALQLNLPERTVDHDLKLGTHIRIFKHDKEKGRYAWIEYESGEENVRRHLETWALGFILSIITDASLKPIESFERYVIPFAAAESGNDPQDEKFRKLCFRVLGEFFKKPERFVTPELLKISAEVVSKRLNKCASELEIILKDEMSKERD